MSSPTSPEGDTSPSRLLLLGILASVFAVNVIDVFAPLLYPEIAATFGVTVGTAVQLGAFSSTAGVATSLALSAFSIKIRYKTLLIAGIFAIVVCVLGVFLAPTFLFAQIFYALNGVGSAIVGIMAPTLIGELYPLEKKAKRISWVLATGTIAILIGNPVTGFIASTGGITSWRSALLWFMLPTVSISLLLAIFLVPAGSVPRTLGAKKEPFLNGYKDIFINRSARACIVNTLFAGIYYPVATFGSSFLANIFGIAPALRSVFALAAVSLMTAGMLSGGLVVNMVGRRRLMVGTAIPAVIFSVIGYPLSIFVQNVWIVLGFRLISGFLGGFTAVAGSSLYLEQVPKFRGTMMSLISSFNSIGLAIGLLLGGSLLNIINDPVLGYPVAMLTLGALGLVGTMNIILFAKDPVKNPPEALLVNLS